MIFFLLFLVILLPITISDYPACYEEGKTWRGSGTWIDGHVSSPAGCHSLCKDFIRICAAWSWYPDIAKDNCFLFESDEREPENCDRCVSGPPTCEDYFCNLPGACAISETAVVGFKPNPWYDDEIGCQTFCRDTPGCTYYTWFGPHGDLYWDCILFNKCELMDCEDCKTGQGDCSQAPTTPTPQVTTMAPPSRPCSPPEDPPIGSWHCISSLGGLLCSLECPPGFAPALHSVTACTLSSTWTKDPSSFSCSEAIALVTTGKNVHLFGPNNSSKVLPDLPDTRDGSHTVDFVNSHVILCGGGGRDYYEYGKSCLALTSNLAWTPISFPLSKRQNHASVVLLGQLFLLGGGWETKTTEMAVPSGKIFDWTMGPNLTEISHRSCAVKVSPTEVVVAGSGSGTGRALTLYQWGTWSATSLPDLPEPISDPGCALVDNPVTKRRELVITRSSLDGGLEDTTTYIFDMQSHLWRSAGPTGVARVRRLAFLGNQLFCLGTQQHTVLEFDFSSETWKESNQGGLSENSVSSDTDLVLTHVSAERFSEVL